MHSIQRRMSVIRLCRPRLSLAVPQPYRSSASLLYDVAALHSCCISDIVLLPSNGNLRYGQKS